MEPPSPVGSRQPVAKRTHKKMQETVDHVGFVALPHGGDEQRPVTFAAPEVSTARRLHERCVETTSSHVAKEVERFIKGMGRRPTQ